MDFYINLKVNFRGNSKNFLLSGSETKNWESMEAMVKRSFGLCSLQLTYYDEENEEVSINSQGEYEEALKSAARQGNRLHMNVYEIRGQPARVPTTKASGAEPKRGFRPPQHCPTLAQVVSRKVQAVVPEQAMVIMKEVKGTKEEDKTPPAWFTSYMEKFKDQVVREAVEKICREFSGQCCIHKPLGGGGGGGGGGAGGVGRGRGEAVGGAEAQQVPEVSSSTLPGSPSSSTPPCSSCRGQTTGGGYQCRTMTPNTPPGCVRAISNKKESDGVLCQMTWSPLSPNLNPIKMVWDEMDHRVKAKGPQGQVMEVAFQLILGNPKAFPGQMRYIIPPGSSGSTPGSPPRWTCSEKSPPRHPNQMAKLPQMAPFDMKEQLPLDVCASHPISKAEPSHPTKKAHFSCLYPRSCSFGHYPELMTIGEGWDVVGLVNGEVHFLAQLPLHYNSPIQCPHYY